MARKSNSMTSVYNRSLTPAQLKELRRKLAKRANQRLVRLERAKSRISDESYLDIGAGRIALDYLNYQKQGRTRFRETLDPEMSYEQMLREVATLESFLESKSSLVSGIREIEKARIMTFESGEWGSASQTGEKRRRLKFASTREFYDFFKSSTFAELTQDGFTSEQIVEAFDAARDRYDGDADAAYEVLENALERFRERGRATLKDLMEAAGGKPLT